MPTIPCEKHLVTAEELLRTQSSTPVLNWLYWIYNNNNIKYANLISLLAVETL